MPETTHKQVRIVEDRSIGLTLAGTEHVLSRDEAKDISRRLADAAFTLAETHALRSDLMRLRRSLRMIADGGPPAEFERIAREALAE